MSLVLITKQNTYKCSCGAGLTQANLNRAKCPECGEQLTEVIYESQYQAKEAPKVNPVEKPSVEKPKSRK